MGAAEKITQAFLDKEFVNAFIQSVINTHRITANIQINSGKASILPKSEKNGEVTGFLGIVSNNSRWVLSISYAKESITEIYGTMFSEKKESIDNDVADLVGEITNQIYGGAKSMLNQRGYAFEMAMPTVITGDFRTHHHGSGVTLNVPFCISNKAYNIWIDITASSDEKKTN